MSYSRLSGSESKFLIERLLTSTLLEVPTTLAELLSIDPVRHQTMRYKAMKIKDDIRGTEHFADLLAAAICSRVQYRTVGLWHDW
jgi:hypothetical protein